LYGGITGGVIGIDYSSGQLRIVSLELSNFLPAENSKETGRKVAVKTQRPMIGSAAVTSPECQQDGCYSGRLRCFWVIRAKSSRNSECGCASMYIIYIT
jgi:hypothetical protein